VMVATAFVSMWVSNTSTTLMMLPVAASIAALVVPDPEVAAPARRNFSTALILSVAYASTIGGLATLIGTPTNAMAAEFLAQTYGIRIGFAEWLLFGVPTVLVLLPLAWWSLVSVTHRFEVPDIGEARAKVRDERTALGRLSVPERRVALIGCLAAAAWIASPLLRKLPVLTGISDMGISMLAALALFLTPAGGGRPGMLLAGADFRRVPWDMLFLFGGGLALAAMIEGSGLSLKIGELLGLLAGWPVLALTAVVVLLIVFWTEFTSNLATAATLLPVLAAMATATGIPILQLVVPAAMAASCGFMLPVGTAPNAIVFGSGRVTLRDMMRAGLLLDILAAAVVVLVATLAAPWLG
jgi:solute carrier family 13 (sodium-dependent dicarboxylate transporter), member 2/3/5